MDRPADQPVVLFRSPQGDEVCAISSTDTQSELVFAAELEDEPFAKMLLLAAALVRAL